MLPMRTAAVPARLTFAALLALLLSLRVIASAGYMPMIEHGRLELTLCPDGAWTAPAPAMPGMDHHGQKTAHHSECPYAAAAATPWANGNAAPMIAAEHVAFARFLPNRVTAKVSTRSPAPPPPATGPPAIA